jgi:hypothetical protein
MDSDLDGFVVRHEPDDADVGEENEAMMAKF